MLNPEEQRMLRWIARDYCQGAGKIVDAGCFRGGSTCSLAQGVRESGRAEIIQTYDLFVAGAYEAQVLGRNPGDGFRDLFDEQTYAYRDLIDVHEGDITSKPWGEAPIELFFIDLSKTIDVNDYLITEFFPHLIPGRSLVIQQDYLWNYLPWLHITMEYFEDYFEELTNTGYNSVVYGVKKTIPVDAAQRGTWNAIGASTRHRLMQQAISKWSGGQKEYLVNAAASHDIALDI